jgi:hypothetical protein
MARPIKKQNNFTTGYDSVLGELGNLAKELNDFKMKALRDYNEVRALAGKDDLADKIQIENIRANCMKSFQEFFKLRVDVLKIHAAVAMKANAKSKEVEEAASLQTGDKEDMMEIMERLRKGIADSKLKN